MSVGRHTLFNLVGLIAPLAAAVAAIPYLINALGPARFGLLTLIWAVVSYFGLFDLGLGRALTQRLATAMAMQERNDRQLAQITGTACTLMAWLGLAAGVIMAVAAPWATSWIREVPDQVEATRAMMVMALAVPAVVLTTGLRAIMEAHNAFAMVNLLRLPFSLLTFLAPVAVAAFWTPRLDVMAGALAAGRWLALAAHAWGVTHISPPTQSRPSFDSSQVRSLLSEGGWLSVGNLIGPVIAYADRLIIATAISTSALASYATPQEIVTKLWIIPGALTAVLFPTFATKAARGESDNWVLVNRSVRWLFVLMLPLTLLLSLFSYPLLALWISPTFALESAPVLTWLAIGILVNCMAHVPLTLLQGSGMARAPALLQLVQVLPYIAMMIMLAPRFGILAAAALWSIRMMLDTAAMFWLCANRFAQRGALSPDPAVITAATISAVTFGVAFTETHWTLRLIAATATSVVVTLILRPWKYGPANSPRIFKPTSILR
jgi:O-antigen/teichoic acid export membrane protein